MPDFPALAFVPIHKLLSYEYPNEPRIRSIRKRLCAERVCRNPILITPFLEEDCFLVLDGTNMLEALKRLKIPDALVQIVQPDDANLKLHTIEPGSAPCADSSIIFSKLTLAVLFELAMQGHCLPHGLVEISISPRALHLNYALEELASGEALAEKNAALQKWIQARLAGKGVRYYGEPTVLFNE